MLWTWDPEKDGKNRIKHKLPLSLGEVALADPLALSQPDPHPDGDRWDTVAAVEGITLFIVHTWPDDDTPGRIISVRPATRHERKAYENG
ncbi:MAG: BrnT family toxin [Magnetospirillum sp.]|nr:BrnT family toxin [Magnetospirillum sp.]